MFYKHSPLFQQMAKPLCCRSSHRPPSFQYYRVYTMGIGGQRGRGRLKSRWIVGVQEEAGNPAETGWRLPRIEVAGNVCLRRPRPNQDCRSDDGDVVGTATPRLWLGDAVYNNHRKWQHSRESRRANTAPLTVWQLSNPTEHFRMFLEHNVLFYMFIESQYKHSFFIFTIKHIWCASFLLQCSNTFNALGTTVITFKYKACHSKHRSIAFTQQYIIHQN